MVEATSGDSNTAEQSAAEPRVGNAQQVLIEYQIHADGILLEGSDPGQPVVYQMGQGQWPVPLELAMLNEPVGSEIELYFSAGDQVFGSVDSERIIVMQIDDFSSTPEVGALLEFSLPNSETTEGQVLKIMGDQVEVDFNHPYAGRDLRVNIKLLAIVSKPREINDASSLSKAPQQESELL